MSSIIAVQPEQHRKILSEGEKINKLVNYNANSFNCPSEKEEDIEQVKEFVECKR